MYKYHIKSIIFPTRTRLDKLTNLKFFFSRDLSGQYPKNITEGNIKAMLSRWDFSNNKSLTFGNNEKVELYDANVTQLSTQTEYVTFDERHLWLGGKVTDAKYRRLQATKP